MIGKIWSTYTFKTNLMCAHDVRSLPGLTNRLVQEVIKANPRTVVVNQTGTPVEMPWVNEAHTLVQVRVLCAFRTYHD